MISHKRLIEEITNKPLPISIIIIGIGDDDFENMDILDGDDINIAKRDVVQFVQMNKFIDNDKIKIHKDAQIN